MSPVQSGNRSDWDACSPLMRVGATEKSQKDASTWNSNQRGWWQRLTGVQYGVKSHLKQVIWQLFLNTHRHAYFISSLERLAGFPGEEVQRWPTPQTAETFVISSICVVCEFIRVRALICDLDSWLQMFTFQFPSDISGPVIILFAQNWRHLGLTALTN